MNRLHFIRQPVAPADKLDRIKAQIRRRLVPSEVAIARTPVEPAKKPAAALLR